MGRVTAVVCAAFDPATDEAIYALRDTVREAGITMAPRPSHRPHFTLTAARVDRDTELDQVLEVAAEIASAHVAIPIVLTEVGRFGRAGALWLGPPPTRELELLHRDVYRGLKRAGWPPEFGERSTPNLWVPHCTIARVPRPRLRAVHELIQADYQPIRGAVTTLATILVGGRGDVGAAELRPR